MPPSRYVRSVWQTPQAVIATTTSPGPGSGTSTSTSWTGSPLFFDTTPRTVWVTPFLLAYRAFRWIYLIRAAGSADNPSWTRRRPGATAEMPFPASVSIVCCLRSPHHRLQMHPASALRAVHHPRRQPQCHDPSPPNGPPDGQLWPGAQTPPSLRRLAVVHSTCMLTGPRNEMLRG